jgi:predicted phage-related endonuclease
MDGKSPDQIAAIIGKPLDYVNSIVNGDVSKFTTLSSEEQTDLLKYNTANKQNLDLEKNKANEAARLALSRAQEDYTKAYADQTQTNANMESNMSVLARIT